MRKTLFAFSRTCFCMFALVFLISNGARAQQTQITDYVIFGGQKTSSPPQTAPLSPGYAVQLGPSTSMQGGLIGSYNLVKSTGNSTIGSAAMPTNIYSGGTVQLTNSNTVTGRITAANVTTIPAPLSPGSVVISIGSGAAISGSIDAANSVLVAGGTVSGTVTIPAPSTVYSYSGPPPAGGVIYGSPQLPMLPEMPAITSFPAAGSAPINNTKIILPGSTWGDVALNGNKTLTLQGTGVYVFRSIKNSGTSNDFVFDFQNQPGNIKMYVWGDADLGKIKARAINDGGTGASRIYLETQGKGTASNPVSFNIANGSAGSASKWLGSVWAPYAAINVGSGTGSTDYTGALWSGTQVNVQSGVSIIFAPFTFCTQPDANAGPDKPLDFSPQTTLTGTSTTTGVSYSWQAINGGIITSSPNQATITVSVAGTYILTVSSGANCYSKDTVVVTSRLKSVIGSELQSIYDNHTTSSPFFVISGDSVMIDVIVNPGYYNYILNLLQTTPYGLTNIISNGTSNLIITGKYPIANLPKLNLLYTEINFCRPYYKAYNNAGIVTSAGDTSMRSYLVRKGYNINGDGIKVGVLSDSYATITSGSVATQPLQPVTNPPNPIPQTFTTNTAAQDVANGDLPGDTTFAVGGHVVNPNGYLKNVHVLKDFPVRLTDEGRAMLEIMHDVAPGAELYFRTGYFTPNDFAVGIKELKDAGCTIICDDITFITEPFLKDGVVATTVDQVVNQGVSYFSAAGNFAKRSYEKNFNGTQVTSGGFAGKMAHNFGGGDIFQHLRLAPGDYTFVLQWTDNIFSLGETEGTDNDLDIYLSPNTDGTALFGFNRDNTDGDPIEFIPFTIPGSGTDSVDANVFIVNNTLTSNPARIKYIIFRGGVRVMEYDEGNSTLVGQANAAGAIAVGAARYDKAPPFLSPALIEPFSSVGGTQTNGVVREKPDFVAPDGVNTMVKMGQDYPNTALDGYSNFFGTSAAAPHAAAVAALIMQGRKKFLGQPITTPSEIRSLMRSTATDMETPGFDFISGYGFVNGDMALRTIAAPTPSIDHLVIPQTTPITIPGATEFTVTIKGENFSSNSVVYYNDSALASTVVLNTNEATAIIPAFEGNPGIRLFTPPYPTTILVNGQHLDGGFSNTLYFFEADITVEAVNATKKYGQSLPALDTIIKVNGVLLQDTTLTLADIGLSSLTLVTPATTNSDVGTYIITPSRIFDENNPDDVAFLQKYNYNFINATLSIEKMPLKVTPEDKSIVYGKHLGNVTFRYEFDPTGVPNPSALVNLIRTYHQGYVPNNALAVVKDFTKTQANGSVLTTNDLLNLNMIASFKAVKNSRKFQLDNNNELVPLSANTFNVQYLVDVASESIYNYKQNPAQAKFFSSSYAGITSKAMLSAASLTNNTAKVELNGSLIQMVNGSLVQMVNTSTGPMVPMLNGSLVQMINGELSPVSNGSLVQLVNGSLVQLVNGEFQPIPNGSLVQLVNGTLIKQISNGSLVQMVNGVETPIITNVTDISAIPNGSLVQLVNGGLVQMVNGSLVQLVNGSLIQMVNGSLIQMVNGSLVQMVNGNTIGVGPNTINNTAVIVDETDVDPLQSNWLGAMIGINMITGLEVGTQALVPGVLVNSNFDITYGLGRVTITDNPCLITHSPDKNFGSTANPGTPTSLWVNVVTKISGQLKSKGDFLEFRSGTIDFNNIMSTPAVANTPIPTGKIIADNVSVPFTRFDAATNTWITKVPVGFSSTSDIFLTGVIINSSTGFVKNNNAYTQVKGMFYSNRNYKDQWAYASAAYQPQFSYSAIADSGQVTSINGNYRAGTPTTQIQNLVNGGSGGGGNNYTGSTNSYDKFTACLSTNPPSGARLVAFNDENVTDNSLKNEFTVAPNPASNYLRVSFVTSVAGNSKISLFTMDGRKVYQADNGILLPGRRYQREIDVSKLPGGIYLLQLTGGASKMSMQKIVISK